MNGQKGKSFQNIFDMAFSLIGMIPFLLAVYVIIAIHADITQGILLAAAAAFCSHLLGLTLLRRNGNKLQTLSNKVRMALTAKMRKTIELDGHAPQELSDLAHSFNTMLGEMDRSNRNYREVTTKMMLYARDIEVYQQRLKDEAIIRHNLGRYVGSNIVEHIVESGGDLPLQNETMKMTILFADIRSFTTLSENMQPEEIITMLNEYFDIMVDIIFEHDGILDKFVGDELMAVFGIIDSGNQAPENAVRSALAMQNKLHELMALRRQQNKPEFKVGIGINTGNVVIGNVGSRNRMDYTVIGDAVNIAARFEQMAEGNTVMMGDETFCRCRGFIHAEKEGEIKVRNRTNPVKYHVVSG